MEALLHEEAVSVPAVHPAPPAALTCQLFPVTWPVLVMLCESYFHCPVKPLPCLLVVMAVCGFSDTQKLVCTFSLPYNHTKTLTWCSRACHRRGFTLKRELSENLLKCFKRGIQTLGVSRVEDRTWKVWKLPL